MEKYKYYKKIIVIGDNSQYLFLKNIIEGKIFLKYSIEELKDFNIVLIYSSKSYVEIYEDINHIEIALDVIDIGTMIFFQKDSFLLNNKIGDSVEKLLVITAFPYNKIDLIDEMNEIINLIKVGEVKGILYKEKRNFGDTDLTDEKKIIDLTRVEFLKYNVKTLIYDVDQNMDINKIFSSEINFEKALKNPYKNKFFRAKEQFENKFDDTYDIVIKSFYKMNCTILDLVAYQDFNSIFEYGSLSKSKSIWQNYLDKFEKSYIEGEFGVLNDIFNIYEEFCKDIAFWNWEKSKIVLEREIIENYRTFCNCDNNSAVPNNEIEYLKLKNEEENSLEILFNEKIKIFFDLRLRAVIKEFINKKFQFKK